MNDETETRLFETLLNKVVSDNLDIVINIESIMLPHIASISTYENYILKYNNGAQ